MVSLNLNFIWSTERQEKKNLWWPHQPEQVTRNKTHRTNQNVKTEQNRTKPEQGKPKDTPSLVHVMRHPVEIVDLRSYLTKYLSYPTYAQIGTWWPS